MKNPYSIVSALEDAVCEYTGAPFCVAVNSCTMAILLSLVWWKRKWNSDNAKVPLNYVSIPKHTYISVPMSIRHAGFNYVHFRDENWLGSYQLKPLPIWDSAREFSSDMYTPGQFICVSFHATKILADTQGGAILLDDPVAAQWLKRARFDGRTEGVAPKDDDFFELGWHCYLSVDVAARLLHKIMVLPKCNDPLPNDQYPDLSRLELFR